jgi:DDE superfamily endonuclease
MILTEHDDVSRETVRRRLAENDLKPWRRDMWCIPHVDGEYVARMVLDLYAEEPDPAHPVVCFDESPTQLIGEARQPVPAEPGRPERYDYEYRLRIPAQRHRQPVRLPRRPWRAVKGTDRRTSRDFAECMRDLVDIHYPEAEQVRVVLDNLSTPSAGALYEAFPACEAHRVLRRLEFHFTPKHASYRLSFA